MKSAIHPSVVSDKSPVVTIVKNHAITTSLDIAEKFDKHHIHIVRDIKKLFEEISNDFQLSNFGYVEIIEENAIGGKVDKSYYEITKDGFILLAMGFTGKKALQFKLAYIEKFNAMEKILIEQTVSSPQIDEPALAARITEKIMNQIGLPAQKPKELDEAGEFNVLFSRIACDIEDEAMARRLWTIFHTMSLVFIGRAADIERKKGIEDVDAGIDEMIARIERLEILKFGKVQKIKK